MWSRSPRPSAPKRSGSAPVAGWRSPPRCAARPCSCPAPWTTPTRTCARRRASTGEALALQRQAEVALHRGQAATAGLLLDEALAVARESNVGFHLLDRIYGSRITAAADPADALARLDEAERAVRGPLETCPG